ncbi:hypothetical protein [uncultured Streptomyces sp.]|uniref:hypothetical protein n=1 Tax=uncultured Streptomyces sp. TaxID=174707 RepID=UPI00261F46BD|nr:hypothetical protein [uncultured Streptomyces sp.]
MGFDEEWAHVRAGAAERASTGMQLNRVPEEGPSAGSGVPKLASTPAEKSAAANTIENELLTSTGKAGRHADEANGNAAAALSGWATAAALKKTQTTWQGQVKTLMARLGRERDGLRSTVTILSGTDVGRHDRIKNISAPSVFDSYQ